MAGVNELMKGMNKTYGKGTVAEGVTTYQTPRLASGLFEFDLGTAGGFPIGKITEIFGPESSGKTNLAISACVEAQRAFPDRYAVFIDAEGGLEGKWMEKMGIDPSRLIVVRPDYAEAVVDMTEKFLEADDVSVVVLDSIAALVATAELEKSAESMIMGGNSIVVQKLIRKSVSALNRVNKAYDEKQREYPAPPLLLINQIRHQIGVMFGSPEKTPGGFAPKFAAAMRVRTYGKNIVDKKISNVMPIAKHTSAVIQKWKVPILGTAMEWEMVTIAHGDYVVRQTKAWNTVEKYLTAMGHLAKKPKSGYVMFEVDYPTLTACREKFNSDPDFRALVLTYLIEEGLKEGGLSVEGEIEGDDAA